MQNVWGLLQQQLCLYPILHFMGAEYMLTTIQGRLILGKGVGGLELTRAMLQMINAISVSIEVGPM